MAVITISDAGGNWNATASWVGGVVPLTTDSILATSTSGPLTVNVTSTIAGMDLTSYTNTLTVSAQLTTSGLNILGSGMTVSGTSFIQQSSGTMSTISPTQPTIPDYRNQGTINFTGDLSILNYTITAGNTLLNGTGSNLISGTFTATAIPNTQYLYGTRTLKMVGTGSVNMNVSTIGGNDYDYDTPGIVNPFVIDTNGTIQISTFTLGHRRLATTASFTYIKGNMLVGGSGATAYPRIIFGGSNAGNIAHSLDSGGMTWSIVGFASNNTNPGIRINLKSDFRAVQTSRNQLPTSTSLGQLTQYYNTPTYFEGTGNIYIGSAVSTVGAEIRFPAGYTHSFGKLIVPTGGVVKASGTASFPRASIVNLFSTQTDYANPNFVDLNFVNPTYVYNNISSTWSSNSGFITTLSTTATQSNTTGITYITGFGGSTGGVSGGSFTFLS